MFSGYIRIGHESVKRENVGMIKKRCERDDGFAAFEWDCWNVVINHSWHPSVQYRCFAGRRT